MKRRDARGRFTQGALRPALDRFTEKCRFDPVTGCVLWTGGTTAGHGNTAVYGSFWFEGRRWFAHRWAAAYIHDLDIGGVTVGHCCPGTPNTLCVQHLKPETLAENVAERNTRVAQSSATRQFWLFVQLGIEPAPPIAEADNDGIPFYAAPDWLRAAAQDDDCPF